MLNINYLVFVFILVLLTGVSFLINYLIFIYKIKHMNIVYEKNKFDLDKIKYKEYEEEKQKILKNKNSEVNEAYDKGFREGYKRAELNLKIITLQIRPYQKDIENSTFFKKTYKCQIGYQYELFVNGIPALSPHQIIEKTIKISQSNEENIKEVIAQVKDTIDKVIKASGGLANFVGDYDQIKDNLIKMLPKKKKN